MSGDFLSPYDLQNRIRKREEKRELDMSGRYYDLGINMHACVKMALMTCVFLPPPRRPVNQNDGMTEIATSCLTISTACYPEAQHPLLVVSEPSQLLSLLSQLPSLPCQPLLIPSTPHLSAP